MTFDVHDKNSAPGESGALLGRAEEKFGFIPNLLGVMSEAPALLKAYMTLGGIFDETSLDATEKQVVLLAVSHNNGCNYCMAAHSAIAAMQDVPDDVITALRENTPIQDEKLQALRRVAHEMADMKGHPSDGALQAFYDAGYSKGQLLEVVLGVGFKTLSNYTNHLAETPLDDKFQPAAWSGD